MATPLFSRLVLISALVLALAACGSDVLYSGMSEREVNEMIAQLRRSGIQAEKSSSGNASYAINVDHANFSQAVEILNAAGLPRKKLKSMGEVFQKEGFVSSPLEERARLNFAQSQELTQTIESIDGVVLARVHLALPEEKALEDEAKPASASVFIKYRPGTDLVKRESQVKALMVNSVEGLPYENVTVVLFPAEAPKRSLPLVVEKESFWVEILAGLVVFLLLLLAYVLWHTRRSVSLPVPSNKVIKLFEPKTGVQQ